MARLSRCKALPQSRIGSRPDWWSRVSVPPTSGRPCPARSGPWRPEGAVRVGLAILYDDFYQRRRGADLDSTFSRVLEARNNEIVGLGERGERSGLRAHVAELGRLCLRDRRYGDGAGRQCSAGERGLFEQCAAIDVQV